MKIHHITILFCLALGSLLAMAAGAQISFDPFVGYAAGQGSTAITAADFDGDGVTDLATANTVADNLSILLGDGDGTFAAPVTATSGESPVHLTACELDNDGLPDLAVANFGFEFDQASVLLNTSTPGSPSFSHTFYPVGSRVTWVACVDVDLDGFRDLVFARLDDDVVEVLINAGDGSFGAGVTYATEVWPWAVAAGDFDNDGLPDLAVINNTSDSVSILINDPASPGTFLPQVTFPVGVRPDDIVAADLDDDGDLDLAVGNRASVSVSVLLNDGAASFADRTDYGSTGGTLSVHAADFDCDGLPDLATDDNNGAQVHILRNDPASPGSFLPFTTFDVADDPRSLVAGNFDNKGSLDLAAASQNTSTVSVLLNQAIKTFSSSVQGGRRDDFAGPTDPASPSPQLAQYLQEFTAFPLADFDSTSDNRIIGHTFKKFPVCVTSAQLEVRARVISSATNDALWIGVHDFSLSTDPPTAKFPWGTTFSERPESGGTWNTTGQTATFVFDLGNLPTSSLRPATSVLDIMAKGELNIYAQDDTALDYAKLTFRSCCNCVDGGQEDGLIAGADDSFAGDTEPAAPSTELEDVLTTFSGQALLDFDQATSDRWFGHTFENLPSCISSARLRWRAMVTGFPSDNDSICLQLVDPNPAAPVFEWCRRFEDLPESGGTWDGNQTAVFELDLADLPPAGDNILDLLESGSLDVATQDDTKIDYLSLTVRPSCGLLFTSDFEFGDTDDWTSATN